MTDDLISLGCGLVAGKILFWGVIIAIALLFTYPWILLMPLGIWLLQKKYGTSGATQSVGVAAGSSERLGKLPATTEPVTATERPGASLAGAEARTRVGGERMICLTWNLGRRSHPGQLDLIRDAGADIIALQEVSAPRRATLASDLAAMGLVHHQGSGATGGAFPFTSMIASRWPIRAASTQALDIPFPERVQVVVVATPFGDVEVLNAHVPAATSSGVAVKVATFEGIARYLSRPAPIPRILCGDFNTPKSEAFGSVQYWGTAHQQSAERAVLEGEATTGLRDAFRTVHGPGTTAASWRASNGVARRYDHVFASQELVPIEASYGDLAQIAANGMSDHAPLVVAFRPTLEDAERMAPAIVATPVSRAPQLPAPVPLAATKQKETPMPSTDDTDLQAFLASLTYRKDERLPPDNARRTQFRVGWRRGVEGRAMTEEVLAAKLTWNNLGYRAGQVYGSKGPATVDAVYDGLAAIYVRERV